MKKMTRRGRLNKLRIKKKKRQMEERGGEKLQKKKIHSQNWKENEI